MAKSAEYALHREIFIKLRRVLPHRVYITSIGHGRRGPKHGAQLKNLGVQPGLPDILIVDSGTAYWIEIKVRGRNLEPEQEACHALLTAAGCARPEVVRSIDDALAAIRRWKLVEDIAA